MTDRTAKWWALPDPVRERALLLDSQPQKPWHPSYIDYHDHVPLVVRCMRCAGDIQSLQPALWKPPGSKKNDPAVPLVTPDGRPYVRMVMSSHFRSGFYRYRRPDGIIGQFEFLHCANCRPQHADGKVLLACNLAGLHDEFEHMVVRTTAGANRDGTMDNWQRFMEGFARVTYEGVTGDSMGPNDFLRESNTGE